MEYPRRPNSVDGENGMLTLHGTICRNLAIVFQILIASLAISGLAVNFIIMPTLPARLNSFSYYTIQSNILVAVAMLLSAWQMWTGREDGRGLMIFKNGAMLWILVTGIVYHLLLAGLWKFTGPMGYVNFSLHTATPVGMVLNWLLFEKKGRYRFDYILYWMTYPLAYLLFSWLRGWLTGIYPYWFLNPTAPYPKGAGSLGIMLGVVSVLVAGFIILELLVFMADRLLGRKQEDRIALI